MNEQEVNELISRANALLGRELDVQTDNGIVRHRFTEISRTIGVGTENNIRFTVLGRLQSVDRRTAQQYPLQFIVEFLENLPIV
jgi:hypothetical protein